MQTSVIEAFPAADLGVTVVWTDRWPFDNIGTAEKSASLIGKDDARVRHFYEPHREVGKAVSRSLGWENPEEDDSAAWDIYLFYPPGVRWESTMPVPASYIHQLGYRDDAAFRTGKDLVEGLRSGTAALLERPGSEPTK